MSDVFSVVVTPLVEEVIKDAKALIKNNYQLLRGVEKDVEKLTSRLTSIRAVVQDAENKQQASSEVRDWLGKLKEFVYDSEDVLETLATEAILWQRKQKERLFRPPLSASQVAYKLNGARAIKELLERVDDIVKEKEILHLNANVGTVTPLNRITTPIHEADMVGRESDKNNIINMLLSEESPDTEANLSVIPIFGMGGLGKTTLAQLIFNDERVSSHFKNRRLWVCVTDHFDYRKILGDMIVSYSKLKIDINSLTNFQLESRVLEILEGNRFLLVLDDVWNDGFQEDWKSVEKILKHGGKGSKVLVTTRFMSVSKVMSTQALIHRLDYLPEEECWSLFEKIAFDKTSLASSVRRDLESIGRQIVEKCKGLPLAIRVMGGFLRVDNNVDFWSRILQDDIWEAEEYNIRTGKPEILPVLRLSYDHLPSDLRECFAYCCLFPKAHVFHKVELIKIWKAASLIKPRGQNELDDIGSDYFDELLSRSLFQLSHVDDKLTCRMHDLIHDLALSVSPPYFYQIRDNRSCIIPEKVRHIAMLSRDAHQHIMDDPTKFRKLRTLVSPVDYSRDFKQALNKLFQTWKCVRILDLSSSMITKLPESVGELKLLHYLDLSKTEIRKLPHSLCRLYNLQTLKLQGCVWLFELPKDFCNLTNLEHLELDNMFWHKSFTLPSNIGSLKNLRNLHSYQIGKKRGWGIEELKNLLHLKGSLHISRLENATKTGEAYLKDKESLVKVIYEWSSRDGSDPQNEAKDREMLEDLQPHPNIEEIEVLNYQGDRLPSWLMNSALQKLTSLSLKHCTKCKILSLGRLPYLRKLHLKGLMELEEWSDAQCHNLRRLKISNCPKLKQLPSSFLNLNVLEIKKCDSLEALPVAPFLQFLILVDNLVLKDFNEQKVRFLYINDQGERVITNRTSFWSLLELKVINCSKLPELPREFAPQRLEISGCPLFTTLPKSEFAGRLQHLAIDTCDDGRLVRLIPNSSSLYSLVISNVRNLSFLPKLAHLPSLKALYIHECDELLSLSDDEEPFAQGLNSLQLLSIRGCPKLESLSESVLPGSLTCLTITSCSSLKCLGHKDVLKKLTVLTDLCIEHCPELESLPEEGFPTSLQHLRIQGCPLLMSRWHDWQKLRDIPDLELEHIEVS